MKLKLLEELKNATAEAPLNFTFGGVQFKFTAKIKIVDEKTLEELTGKQGANDKEIVRDLYEEDIVEFGYEFNSTY